MSLAPGHGIALAAIFVGNALAIWLAAWAVVRNNHLGSGVRASWYQLLLWIPVVIIILILLMPVAAEVAAPETRDELLQRYGVLIAVMVASGVFGTKWAYELDLRAGALIYGVALAVQAAAWGSVLGMKPSLWQWVPYSHILRAG